MAGARLHGLDAARALAFIGMVLAHFATSTSVEDPGWLQAIDDAANGRAAPLFAVLLGTGCGLYLQHRSAAQLARRGLALLVVGLVLWPHVERVYLILPQYGVLTLLASLTRRVATRWLLPLAALCWLVPSLVVAGVDGHGIRSADQPDTYAELLDVGSIAWQLLWSGGYPVVGWAGFVLVGLWLARLRLGDGTVARRLVVAGAGVALLQPALSALSVSVAAAPGGPQARGLRTLLDSTAHSNQLGWYVVASATAVVVIGVALVVAPGPDGWLVRLGRSALSAYLAHLLLGVHVVWPWRDETAPTLGVQVLVAAATVASIAALAGVLAHLGRRGPAEAALRSIAP